MSSGAQRRDGAGEEYDDISISATTKNLSERWWNAPALPPWRPTRQHPNRNERKSFADGTVKPAVSF
jgi:hypothetical protein